MLFSSAKQAEVRGEWEVERERERRGKEEGKKKVEEKEREFRPVGLSNSKKNSSLSQKTKNQNSLSGQPHVFDDRRLQDDWRSLARGLRGDEGALLGAGRGEQGKKEEKNRFFFFFFSLCRREKKKLSPLSLSLSLSLLFLLPTK